jgi:hypothetical protein
MEKQRVHHGHIYKTLLKTPSDYILGVIVACGHGSKDRFLNEVSMMTSCPRSGVKGREKTCGIFARQLGN